MKHAMELVMIKEVANMNYAIEQELLDRKCAEKHKEIIQDTIKFCEDVIGPRLENYALKRCSIFWDMNGALSKDRLGNVLFHPLVKETVKYANGESSYRVDSNTSYDAATLMKYLNQFGYITEWKDCNYKQYNCGRRSGVSFQVSIH